MNVRYCWSLFEVKIKLIQTFHLKINSWAIWNCSSFNLQILIWIYVSNWKCIMFVSVVEVKSVLCFLSFLNIDFFFISISRISFLAIYLSQHFSSFYLSRILNELNENSSACVRIPLTSYSIYSNDIRLVIKLKNCNPKSSRRVVAKSKRDHSIQLKFWNTLQSEMFRLHHIIILWLRRREFLFEPKSHRQFVYIRLKTNLWDVNKCG